MKIQPMSFDHDPRDLTEMLAHSAGSGLELYDADESTLVDDEDGDDDGLDFGSYGEDSWIERLSSRPQQSDAFNDDLVRWRLD